MPQLHKLPPSHNISDLKFLLFLYKSSWHTLFPMCRDNIFSLDIRLNCNFTLLLGLAWKLSCADREIQKNSGKLNKYVCGISFISMHSVIAVSIKGIKSKQRLIALYTQTMWHNIKTYTWNKLGTLWSCAAFPTPAQVTTWLTHRDRQPFTLTFS